MLEQTIEMLLIKTGLQNPAALPAANQDSVDTSIVHYYNGKYHLLPQSFDLPKVGIFEAWKLWWLGDKRDRYPPLRRVRAHDLPNPALQKRSSDWCMIMQHIKSAIIDTSEQIPAAMTEGEASRPFNVGVGKLPLAPSTRKRRVSELCVGARLGDDTSTCAASKKIKPECFLIG